MQMPIETPSRPIVARFAAASRREECARKGPDTGTLAPAACCAETCANVPFVGRVCQCILDLPICP